MRHLFQMGSSALLAAGVLLAPVALAQVADLPCGTPPKAIQGRIPFTDITVQIGYQQVAAPTADTMPDYWGGIGGLCTESECFSSLQETFVDGPFSQAYDLGTVALPFPFGFSGIYADGGGFNQPFNVTVWANGLLTFDPSVSFNPSKFPLQQLPPDCQLEETQVCGNQCYPITESLGNEAAVSDTFGGFPFSRQWGPPNALIAPWWGDLSVCPNFGQVGWLLTLDEKNLPMLVIQWTNLTATKVEHPSPDTCSTGGWSSCLDENLQPYEPGGTLPQFSFQARLHANSDVDFVYGPASNLNPTGDCFEQAVGNCGYVSGIQSNLVFPSGTRPPLLDYTAQALDCNETTGCLQPQFPSGTSVTFRDVFRSVGPDLQVVAIAPPGQIAQGGTVTVPTSLSNGGGGDSTGQGTLQFYFSSGGTSPEGSPFSVQSIPTYHACSTAPYPAKITLPAGVPQGGGYLIAELVPGQESVDQTHSFAFAPIVIGPQGVDLAAVGALSFTPPAVVGGQSVSISFQAQNVGQIAVPSAPYSVYVSLGGSLSRNDLKLGGGFISNLAPSAAPQMVSGTFTVPATLVSGTYLVGAIIDPDGTLGDTDLTNNDAVGGKLLGVTSPGPTIETTSLHDAQANSPYSVQLRAAGGDGKYLWALNAGALPAGLAISKTGLINGQAESAGTSQFEVKVTDQAGHSATATLSLTVSSFAPPLGIVTAELPAGSTSQLYDFAIAATGGLPPYRWALAPGSGALPAGIQLLATGLITGEPLFDGSSRFQVMVTDSAGASVTSPNFTLTVYASGTLAVGSTLVGPCKVGKTCNELLHYVGGTGPYLWTLLDAQREPNSPGDTGQDLGPNLPPQLQWFSHEGEIEGIPQQAGVFALDVEVVDSEVPPAVATGMVILTISSSTSFSFKTVQLPDATLNEFYSTQLATTADPDPVTCQVLNTQQLPTDTAKLALAPGVELYESDCQISGVPLELGTFSFLVEAADRQGDVAIQSFTINVVKGAVSGSSSGGCQSGAGAPALAGLLLLALGGIRRKRRR